MRETEKGKEGTKKKKKDKRGVKRKGIEEKKD